METPAEDAELEPVTAINLHIDMEEVFSTSRQNTSYSKCHIFNRLCVLVAVHQDNKVLHSRK